MKLTKAMTTEAPHVLAIVNAKGGVSKTTTAVSLAAGFALRGRRTLLVDLDQQASASLGLGVARASLEPGSAAVLLEGLPLRRAIRPTSCAGLDLVTGELDLANADVALAGAGDRATRLRHALEPVRGDYAHVVLDCPPSLGLLTVNALLAADSFLVPVVPEYLVLEGVAGLLASVERLRAAGGDAAELLGFVLTRTNRTRAAGEVADILRAHYGRAVFKAEIPANVRVAEAPSFGLTIYEHAPGSTGADAYSRLTAEVLRRFNQDGSTSKRKGGKTA